MPCPICGKLCTDTHFYMSYNSPFVSHWIRATFVFNHATFLGIFKNGIKCFFIDPSMVKCAKSA
jgi:hypothetical protein